MTGLCLSYPWYSPLNYLNLAAPSSTQNTWYLFGPYIMAVTQSSQITPHCSISASTDTLYHSSM